ncbi:response regulator [Paenibacillus sp. TAB 01]|uniref:response regulator n=1 Tax=Paenibacillus sp. TAB 01 TaxID=3368988 RepID=UPI003752B485
MHTTGRYNILIVDDEPLFRLALRNLLSTGGFNVQVIGEASDGEEALLYKDHDPMPDLIFVDMKMPRMNGVEFIRRWKEDSGTGIGNQAIFIALSSYQDYAFVRDAFLLGALDYIVKVDMTPSYLLPVVEKALAELDKRKLEPWIDMNNKINGKQALFKKMLQPDSDEEAVRKQLAELGIVLSEKERGLAVILTDRQQPENGREAGGEVIRSVLEQVLQAKGLQAEIVIVQPDEHVLLLYQTQVSSYMYFWNRSHELFSVVQRRLSRYANLTVTIGVSTIGMKPWKSLYREAVEAASLRFFCGGGRLFLPDSRKAWEYEQAKQLLKESETDAEARALLETLGNPGPQSVGEQVSSMVAARHSSGRGGAGAQAVLRLCLEIRCGFTSPRLQMGAAAGAVPAAVSAARSMQDAGAAVGAAKRADRSRSSQTA